MSRRKKLINRTDNPQYQFEAIKGRAHRGNGCARPFIVYVVCFFFRSLLVWMWASALHLSGKGAFSVKENE